MQIKNFTENYYLVGLAISENKDTHVQRYGFNFLFKNPSITGYGTMKISADRDKVEKLLGGAPVVGKVYKVYTDKFLTADKQLITFLKDIVEDKNFKGE